MGALLLVCGLGGGIFSIIRLVQAFQNVSSRIGKNYGFIFQILFSFMIFAVLSSLSAIISWNLSHEKTMPDWTLAGRLEETAIAFYNLRWTITTVAAINWFVNISIVVFLFVLMRKYKDTDELDQSANSG